MIWSVWIFLTIENPLSELALEQGINNSPEISLKSKANRSWPSRVVTFPTSLQNMVMEEPGGNLKRSIKSSAQHIVWNTAMTNSLL